MGIFGWSYPAGAADDPLAPYNETAYEEDDLEHVAIAMAETYDDGTYTKVINDIAERFPSVEREILEAIWEGVDAMAHYERDR